MIKKKCKYCGKTFVTGKYHVKRQIYCSHKCGDRAYRRTKKFREYRKAYNIANAESIRRYQRDRIKLYKVECVQHYGGKCAVCGDSHMEFLTIDHVEGGGVKHRKLLNKAGSRFYRWLRAQGYPSGYRVLCFNCNCSIGMYGYSPLDGKTKSVFAEFTK